MPTPALDLKGQGRVTSVVQVAEPDFNRKPSTELAQLRRDNQNDLLMLRKIEGALIDRTRPISVATLELVRQDIERLRREQARPTTRPGRWIKISMATLVAAIAIGFAQGLGAQLWASVWPIVAQQLKPFATLFGG